MLILLTTPIAPPASIKSPALNGLNTSNMTPAAKFCKEPCNDRPIAKPAAAKMAANEVVLTFN